jgi:hypothetical protein
VTVGKVLGNEIVPILKAMSQDRYQQFSDAGVIDRLSVPYRGPHRTPAISSGLCDSAAASNSTQALSLPGSVSPRGPRGLVRHGLTGWLWLGSPGDPPLGNGQQMGSNRPP